MKTAVIYCFGADYFDKILLKAINNVEHLDALEKLHIEYFGETDEQLFNEEIRELLR